MLPRIEITAYSLQSESDCCKPFIECFKEQKKENYLFLHMVGMYTKVQPISSVRQILSI